MPATTTVTTATNRSEFAKSTSVARLLGAMLQMLLIAASTTIAAAQPTNLGTAFTYQGHLSLSGAPFNGNADIEFRLFDVATGGASLATTAVANVPVSAGQFTAEVNLGTVFDGRALWLELGVRATGGPPPYTTLLPRQKITAAPYALGVRLPLRETVAAQDDNALRIQNSASGGRGLLGLASGVNGKGVYGSATGNGGIGVFGDCGSGALAIEGLHAASGNYGDLGTASVGAQGVAATSASSGVVGTHVPTGNIGRLGTSESGVVGWATGVAGHAVTGRHEHGNYAELGLYYSALVAVTGSDPTSRAADFLATNGRMAVLASSTNSIARLADGLNSTGVTGGSNTGVGVRGEVTGIGPEIGVGVLAYGGGLSNALVVEFVGDGASTTTLNNCAIFRAGLVPTINVARIDRTGRGFFNGGTQTGGADVAEAMCVEGDATTYGPGEVLVISANMDRAVTRSAEAYSTLVAGVYATKPGLLLTDKHIDDPLSGMVPVGVIGILPTHVSAENGRIRRGDLLVTAATPGRAMKGTDRARMLGAIIGKALQDFDGPGEGTIEVMVNLK